MTYFRTVASRRFAATGMDSFSMGLGLYIASTIAEAHQGTLTVESTREHGTTFTARLPLAPAA